MKYFYEPVRIKSENIVFVGCPHLDHDKPFILNPRQFNNVDEANRAFIERMNKVCDNETTLFFLGDVMFGAGGLEKLEDKFLSRLNFDKLYMMPGNHYAGYKQMFNQAMEANGEPIYYLKNNREIHLIPNYLEIIVGGNQNPKMNMVLSHYPILSWNGNGGGSVMLYSHCHNSLRNSELGRMYEVNGKCLEVSVERSIEINESLPFTLADIRRIMKSKETFAVDHHTKSTNNPF